MDLIHEKMKTPGTKKSADFKSLGMNSFDSVWCVEAFFVLSGTAELGIFEMTEFRRCETIATSHKKNLTFPAHMQRALTLILAHPVRENVINVFATKRNQI